MRLILDAPLRPDSLARLRALSDSLEVVAVAGDPDGMIPTLNRVDPGRGY